MLKAWGSLDHSGSNINTEHFHKQPIHLRPIRWVMWIQFGMCWAALLKNKKTEAFFFFFLQSQDEGVHHYPIHCCRICATQEIMVCSPDRLNRARTKISNGFSNRNLVMSQQEAGQARVDRHGFNDKKKSTQNSCTFVVLVSWENQIKLSLLFDLLTCSALRYLKSLSTRIPVNWREAA